MKIRIVDNLNPEDTAMLQALYSRSAESVDTHLEKVKRTGSGRFMSQYYVGYNHKSIADCGSTTMFIEGVSLLAAKAIQDWPLYSGQETSTRYIDMGKQPIVDPLQTPESKAVLDRWMQFYISKQGTVGEILRARYPRRESENVETYDRAIKARTFDVLRGFLPAGVTTQLSWHTNLRQGGDHLGWLRYHPAPEMQEITRRLTEALAEWYPSSNFALGAAAVSGVDSKNDAARQAREAWTAKTADLYTYSVDPSYHHDDAVAMTATPGRPGRTLTELVNSERYGEMLRTRPRGCVLPHFMSDTCQFTFDFLLDFGSFRDIQRHRNGVCRMPLLTRAWGFHPWYLEQLGDPTNGDVGGLRDEAVQLIHEQQTAIGALAQREPQRAVLLQYYTALGYNVPCQVTYALPALLYVLELRSSKTVHPSLRRVIHAMIRQFQAAYPDVALHADMDIDDWDVRRGNQTITEK